MLHPTLLITVQLLCLLQISCKSEYEKTLNGFPYQITSSHDKPKPTPGQIVYYFQSIHPEELTDIPPNYSETYNIFRFVDDQALTQLNNPTYDLLKYLGQNDEGKVFYTKSSDKKYPAEYGAGEKVVFYIKVLEILSEEQHQKNEVKNREKLMQYREDYFNEGLKIDSLIQVHLQEIIKSKSLSELGGVQILSLVTNSFTTQKNKTQNQSNIIKISYSVYTLNGKKITSSFENREPYITQLNSDKIPPGWQKILSQMDEKAEVFCLIPAKLLYGTVGFKGNVNIPPNTDLIFYFKIEEILRN
jgi:FKBP-type peptidyl-prolyl cis-trans isomerase